MKDMKDMKEKEKDIDKEREKEKEREKDKQKRTENSNGTIGRKIRIKSPALPSNLNEMLL